VFSAYIMNPDGTNMRRVLNPLDPEFRTMNPNWSPDGEKIIFTYYDLSVAGIGYVNSSDIGGSTFNSVYEEPWANSLPRGPPCYSPDGEKIVFYRTGDGEIYLMNSDGSNLENLTNHPARDALPMFLPDGRILFVSDRANPNQIPIQHDLWLMNADGSNPIRLTFEQGVEVDPMVSCDGKYLLFVHDIDMSNPQIYITEFTNAWDRTKWTQLTTQGSNSHPTWRPKKED
ncbi:hypothetical protein FJZ20_00395, partial [Candidatus Pacearchaeota archaeon]|nr:hypothetical protein [Candidatus Pacearchaeota archaeon]